MARIVLDLASLSWQIGQAPRQPFGHAPQDDRASVTRWLPAVVPGDVRADLIAAGLIPPVETPEQIAAGAWVDGCDWWYRAELPGGVDTDACALLEADGIDYYSAIWVDGHLLATHAGMFGRQSVVMTRPLAAPGSHELAIRVWGGGVFRPAHRSPWQCAGQLLERAAGPAAQYFSERYGTTKAQFSFGWDFAPRLLSTGIWDEIRLVRTHGVYVENLWAHGEPLSDGEDLVHARWHISLTLRRWRREPLWAEISIEPENFTPMAGAPQVHTVSLGPETEFGYLREYRFNLEPALARPWWPWDAGEPCLYRVTVRIRNHQGPLDEITCTAGVRTVRRSSLPGGRWQFVVNGRKLFLRGLNWTPPDLLPGRAREDDYARLLGQARAVGANFVRVWGGGLREKRAFWDLCDRLGLMAWQEFPLACDTLQTYPRASGYLNTLADEACGTVRLLRNHPSLIAWCGGNEISPSRERLPLRTIAAAVARHDSTRPWIPASPSEGDLHYWDVWHGFAPWTDLAHVEAPFVSEFGLQALPDARSIAGMFPQGAPPSLRDRRWSARKAEAAKLLHYAGLRGDEDLDRCIAATQRVQAAALQLGIESCRLRRSICGGVAIWQFNEPWLAVTWSVIDARGRPKAAYEMLRHSYAPLLVAARFPWRDYAPGDTFSAGLWVVNDGRQAWQGCHLTVSLDGVQVWTSEDVSIGPGALTRLGRLIYRLPGRPRRLTLRLHCSAEIVAANSYDLDVPRSRPRPLGRRLYRWLLRRLLG